MISLHPQYIKDTAGKNLVVLAQSEFNSLISELEEMEEIKIYDEVKARNEPSINLREAIKLRKEKNR